MALLLNLGAFLISGALAVAWWRCQLVAKRRYEVAEQLLIAADAAANGLRNVRQSRADDLDAARIHPNGFSPSPWQTSTNRLQEADELIKKLRQATTLAEFHFGSQLTEALRDLIAIYRTLVDANRQLYFDHPANKMYPDPEHTARRAEWEAAIDALKGDKPDLQITAAMKEATETFGPLLRPALLNYLLPCIERSPRRKRSIA
ncbi:hypothetical protein EOD42_22655 [Rhodovarius crocodyli]|uniref:Uncharacterized protein n=1 Tax=Rhodovarius crocodyli TaxID=1979269 RepID=A0A437M174_9PROT|nr:hypothetical protein [Rhodovarius crocodyli]RVT91460.1 hypothetical protein EOD42_22655 [Rhodovarius crocodyli]